MEISFVIMKPTVLVADTMEEIAVRDKMSIAGYVGILSFAAAKKLASICVTMTAAMAAAMAAMAAMAALAALAAALETAYVMTA